LRLKVVAPVLLVAAFAGYGAYTLTKSSADSGATLVIKLLPEGGVQPQDANVIVTLTQASSISDYGSCHTVSESRYKLPQYVGTTAQGGGVAIPVDGNGVICTGVHLAEWTPAKQLYPVRPLMFVGPQQGVEHTAHTISTIKDNTNSPDQSPCSGGVSCSFNYTNGTLEVGIRVTPNTQNLPLSTLPRLSASNVTTNSVDLKWTDISNSANNRWVLEWALYKDDSKHVISGGYTPFDSADDPGNGNPGSGPLGSMNNPFPHATHSYTQTGLTPCTTYHFGLQMHEGIKKPDVDSGPESDQYQFAGPDQLNFVTVKTAGCPPATAAAPASTQAKGSSGPSNPVVDSNSPDSAHYTSNSQLAEGTAIEGIFNDGITTISQHEQAQQHRRSLALTIGLAVVAVGLAAVIVNKYVRKRA
jgi:hypothetical protein